LLALRELPSPDHASDALAVALCHSNASPLQNVLANAVSTR
jgi:Holliday junction resolvasome RuvABC endonuclease subunit